MSSRVGKEEKSVGFFMYKEIKIISTERAMEIVSKKSSTRPGSGTMMMAMMVMIKRTTVKSLLSRSALSELVRRSKIMRVLFIAHPVKVIKGILHYFNTFFIKRCYNLLKFYLLEVIHG